MEMTRRQKNLHNFCQAFSILLLRKKAQKVDGNLASFTFAAFKINPHKNIAHKYKHYTEMSLTSLYVWLYIQAYLNIVL